jgi:hypothetical protein
MATHLDTGCMVTDWPGCGRLTVGRWVLANVVAFTVAGMLGGTLLRSLQQPYYTVVSSTAQAVRIQVMTGGAHGTIFGALAGASQWWAIRGHPAAKWWPPATFLGLAVFGLGSAVISGVAGGPVSTIGPSSVPVWLTIAAALSGVLVLMLAGAFQWLVLRRFADSAAWWPVWTFLGLALGFGAGLVIARGVLVEIVPVFVDTDFPSGKVLTVVGAVAGVVYALVTGPALARALRTARLRGRAAITTSRP